MYKRLKCLLAIFSLCLCLTGCSGTTQTTENVKNATETTDLSVQKSDVNQYGDGATDTTGIDGSNNAGNTNTDNLELTDDDTLEVHYLDVGQGDAVLIKQGDSAMLIDAGNNDKGTTVWSYLLSQNIESLEYAIGTHPDADHIGGLDVVLYKTDCNTIFLPACENDTKTYEELIQTIGQRNQAVVVPQQGETYSLGKASFQILTDTDKDYGEETNDFSIAIRMVFGETSFLFTGDAGLEAEQDMLASGLTLSADVYKAAHHGADTANSESFLTAVNPTYCVISCGEGNSYGHPRAGFLNHMRSMGVNVFRTDEQGTIVAVSDGTNITFNCSPSTTWQAGEPTGSGQGNDAKDMELSEDLMDSQSNDGTAREKYILNTSSKKFHRSDCGSVAQMSDKNKQESDKSREELIEQGYEPCKNCNP